MKKFFSGLALLTAVIALTACNDDIRGGGNALSKNKITFTLGGSESTKTRSEAAPLSFALDGQVIDGKAVCLEQEVTVMDEPVMDDAMGTRGTPVFTENFKDVFGSFTAAAVYNGTTRRTDLQGEFAWESNDGSVPTYSKQYSDNQQWPESGTLLYFLQAPVSMPAGIETLTYDTTTGATTFTVGSSYPKNAIDQKDILFTSKEIEVPEGGIDNEVHRILFYHVFSGVKFKLKEDGVNGVYITAIKSVKFTNLISQGTCTVTPSYDGDEFNQSNANAGTEKSATQSVWTYAATPARGEFSQTFTTDEQGVDLTTDASGYNYPNSFTGATANKGKNLNNAKATKTFYLIPQTLTDDVMLTITYTYSDGVTTAEGTATIPFGTKTKTNSGYLKWEAGKLYTYTLSIGDKVDVDIDDVVTASNNTKSNLTITNTASATSYMRVAVIGNWVYDGTDATVPIAITPTGSEFITCVDDQYNKTDWFKSGDYYYYKHPVPGGKTIKSDNTLFKTLNLNSMYTTYKPYDDCYLDVTICVQAVRATQAATAWGVSGFDTTVKDE